MAWDWGDKIKYRVHYLYISQNKSLHEVMKIVNAEFGMDASSRTYQKKLKIWGFSKEGTRAPRRKRPIGALTSSQWTIELIPLEPQSSNQAPFSIPRISCTSEGTPSDHGSFTPSDLSVLEAHSSVRDSPIDMECIYDIDLGEEDVDSELFEISSNGHNMLETFVPDATIPIPIPRLPTVTHDSLDASPANPSPQITQLATYPEEPFIEIQHSLFSADKYTEVADLETLLQKLSTDDANLLLFCSFFDHTSISLQILGGLLERSPESIDISIKRLSDYKLVSQLPTISKNISIDRNIHAYLWDRIHPSERPSTERKVIMQVSSSIALGCIPSKKHWAFARLVIPYLARFIEMILHYDNARPFWDCKSLKAAAEIADVTRRLGEDKKSLEILEHILPLMENILGEQDSLALETMNSLSVTLIGRKKWKAAEGLLHRLILVRQSSPDTDRCSYVTELSNWVRVLAKLGWQDDVERAVDLIVQQGNSLLVGSSSETRRYKTKLGETYRFCGRLMEAESLLKGVHKESRRMLGDSDPETLRALEHLCYVYSDQGDLVSAEKLSSELVHLSEKALGKMQTDTLRRTKFLGRINRKKGKSKE